MNCEIIKYIIVIILSILIKACNCKIYSSFKAHRVYKYNNSISYLEFNNVCLSKYADVNHIIYYQNPNEENYFSFLDREYRNLFQTTKVYVSEDDIPSYYLLEWKNVWVINQFIKKHIIHFLELYMSLWFYDNNIMPPIERLIHLSYSPELDLDFNNLLYKLLIKRLKTKTKQNIIETYLNRARETNMICFKRIYFFLKHQPLGLMSWFGNKKEHIEFRDYIFDELKMNNKMDDKMDELKKRIRIAIIVRKENNKMKNRNIINLKEIYKLIKAKNENSEISILSFDKLNPREQMEKIMRCNLIISPHGCSLFNIIWLISKRVIILELFNKYFIRQELMRESLTYEYKYLPIFTTKQLYSDEYEYSDERLKILKLKSNIICNGVICLFNSFDRVNYDIYVNMKSFSFSLDYSLSYLSISN